MPVCKSILTALAGVAVLSVLACSPGGGQQAAAPADAAAQAPAPQGGVTRTQVTPPPAPTPPPQQAVIQTQPGPEGAQVALNTVRVTGDVMTVQLTYTAEGGTANLDLDEVSVIDDATAQRIGVLKDAQGKWLAAPLDSSGDGLSINMYESPSIVWFKFPAPPPTSPTVSVNVPEVAPFDGVPVSR